MKKPLFLVYLLSIAFQMNLPGLGGNDIQKILLEEVLSIGSLEDDVLFQWVGVISDSTGHIYVTDNMDYSLKKFDDKGNLIKKTGRKGQGPGEFLAPRYLGISSELLYVTDQFKSGIQVFDKDLNYSHGISVSVPVYDLKVLEDDEIAVTTVSTAKAGMIFILNSKGKIKRELQYSDKKSRLLTDVVNFDLDSQGNLYLVYNYQDKIEKFDPEGIKIWSQKLLGIKDIKKEKIGQFVLPTKFVYKDIALDSSGNLFILGGSFSKNPSCDVYVLSPGGKHLTTFTLPDSSHCIYIDSNDFLYSRADEGVTLNKFKIKYVPE
ncbi:MAG: 6-bladed beta-propeller [Candidatus Aminicenantes bacterium]|nr:6-bladed beta-propeller [Candidatus Aminicenantes bacterium]